MVLVKMLRKIALPKMGELLVMMTTMISPSGREVPPAESLCWRAKVLLPKFRLEAAALHPECLPLIFFYVKMTYIPEEGHRRSSWVSTTHQGAVGSLACPGGLFPPGGPPLVLIGSNIPHIFHKKSP